MLRHSALAKDAVPMNDNRKRMRVAPTFALLMLVPIFVWVLGWV